MGPNQNPLVPNQNPLTPNQSPYATPVDVAPATQRRRDPVEPRRSSGRRAFRGVPHPGVCLDVRRAPADRRRRLRRPEQRRGCSNFAGEWTFLLLIAQLGLVFAIAGAINRISATVALGLFFVYAASVGITIGLIVSFYTDGVGCDGLPVGVRDVRRCGDLRSRDQALAGRARRHPVHGPDRPDRRLRAQHLPWLGRS